MLCLNVLNALRSTSCVAIACVEFDIFTPTPYPRLHQFVTQIRSDGGNAFQVAWHMLCWMTSFTRVTVLVHKTRKGDILSHFLNMSYVPAMQDISRHEAPSTTEKGYVVMFVFHTFFHSKISYKQERTTPNSSPTRSMHTGTVLRNMSYSSHGLQHYEL